MWICQDLLSNFTSIQVFNRIASSIVWVLLAWVVRREGRRACSLPPIFFSLFSCAVCQAKPIHTPTQSTTNPCQQRRSERRKEGRKEGRKDGDGNGCAGGGGGRRRDLPLGALRLHARRLHGRRHHLPQPARGDPLRPPRHRLHPRPPPLRLQPPLRRPRRRQLQPHRRRRLLRRGPHQPLALLHRAPPTSAGRRSRGRSSGHLRADARAVQAHARRTLAQGGSPHRRRRRRGAHLRHHLCRPLHHRQGTPQPHRQDSDALRLHRQPRPHRRRVYRPLHEPCQRVWLGVC